MRYCDDVKALPQLPLKCRPYSGLLNRIEWCQQFLVRDAAHNSDSLRVTIPNEKKGSLRGKKGNLIVVSQGFIVSRGNTFVEKCIRGW